MAELLKKLQAAAMAGLTLVAQTSYWLPMEGVQESATGLSHLLTNHTLGAAAQPCVQGLGSMSSLRLICASMQFTWPHAAACVP